MPLTKIHSALLLAFIAGLTLAVSSQPLRKDPVKKLELTFLDHRTGRTRWGGRKKRPGSYTLLINKVLNMKGAKWVSAGTYFPEGKNRATFFKLEGGPHCPLSAPCFGWRVKGPLLLPSTKNKPANPDFVKNKVDYIGITRGLPNKDGMAECIGIYPAWARDDNGARQQWETYRDKFNSLSIPGVPKTGSLSEPFQAAPTVTFIRIEDGQPLSLKPTDSSADLSAEGKDMAQEFRRSITNQINHILGISGTGTVTYEYTPRLTSESANKVHYYKFVGGDERCTADAPCYGWVRKGPYGKPGKSVVESSYEEGLYLGIGKPRVEGKELDIIGSHPEMNRVTGRPADGLMGKEWTTQLLAFTVKIELMLSKQ